MSVALSGDTALVGALLREVDGKNNQGVAYVFVRAGGAWVQQAKLVAADGAADDWFGISVALSGDTALIGARNHDVDGKSAQGAAYVFVRSGTTWTQQAKLTASDGAAGDWFGSKLALSGDTALLGARYHDVGARSNAGAAYVFVRSAGAWVQQAQLVASDGAADDWFGDSESLDGDTAVVGASGHDVEGRSDQGAAYVFVRSGTTWTQQAKLIASDGAAGDWCGLASSLSGDTALLGARYHDVQGRSDQGAAYVFVRSGTTWTQQAELTASDGAAGDWFGAKLALSGGAALVGGHYHDVGGAADRGGAWVFVPSGATWTQQEGLAASDGAAGDLFGDGIAMDAETALVGAYKHDVAGVSQGAAYVFAVGEAPSTRATAATVKAGKTVKLRYIVNDPLPSTGRAAATIEIRKGSSVVKRVTLGVCAVNTPLAYTYRAKLKRGTYTWRVLATDLAGNASTDVVAAKLRVR